MFKKLFNWLFERKPISNEIKPILIDRRFDQFITENSPAEVSVINFADNNAYEILYINNTKAIEFGIEDIQTIIGKKCYEIFEGKSVPCECCPAKEAIEKNRKIHKDWEYLQPSKKEKRYASITAKRIEDTSHVVEICRDSTIRKIVSDLVAEMASIRSIEELDKLLSNELLTKLYFKRYRLYLYNVEESTFVLKSAYKLVLNQNISVQQDEEIISADLINKYILSTPDKYIVNEGIKAKPKLYLISSFIPNFDYSLLNEKYCSVLDSNDEYIENSVLKKEIYPVWLDIPIVSKNKIIGKISIDKIESDWSKNIDEYDFNFFEILSRSISKTMENLLLSDQSSLHGITEVVLNYSLTDNERIFTKIHELGIKYLDSIHSGLFLNFDDKNSLYVEGKMGRKVKISQPSFKLNLLSENLLKNDLVFGRNYSEVLEKYFDSNVDIKKLLLKTLQIENRILGILIIYDCGDKFNDEFFLKKINLLANQTVLAINKMQQYYEIEKQKNEAIRNADKAEESLKTRNEFFDAANHEIISPLGPILHCLLYMQKKNMESENPIFANMIQNSIFNCEFLIKAFDNIDFVKPGKEVKLKKVTCQLFKDIIIPMVITCRYYAKAYNKNIEFSGIEFVGKFVFVDKDRMMNVFFNLISNAIRYSDNNTTIQIKGVRELDDVSYIDVVNYGIGIPENEKEKIFDKYYRAENAKKNDIQGTGIGLYIVDKILRAHGGKIIIHKNINPTIFRLLIPNNFEL